MDTFDILDRARHRLHQGWGKGAFKQENGVVKYCIVGAVAEECGALRPEEDEEIYSVRDAHGWFVVYNRSFSAALNVLWPEDGKLLNTKVEKLAEVNDCSEFEDVLALIDRALDRTRHGVA